MLSLRPFCALLIALPVLAEPIIDTSDVMIPVFSSEEVVELSAPVTEEVSFIIETTQEIGEEIEEGEVSLSCLEDCVEKQDEPYLEEEIVEVTESLSDDQLCLEEEIPNLPVVLGGNLADDEESTEILATVAPEKNEDDEFLEGYLQALVDVYYCEQEVCVQVVGGTAYLYNLPSNGLTSDSIVCLVSNHPCVQDVVQMEKKCSPCHPERIASSVVWFPQNTVLFAPLVADPRQISFSVSYRMHDKGIADRVGAISFGDIFPVVRWCGVWPWNGDMQFDIEAGAWGIFDMSQSSTPLINVDYYIGLPLSYAVGPWAFRARLWHISSHLGDEYMVLHPEVERKNLSKEGVDLFFSYQMACAIRYYGGIGTIIAQDEEFERENLYIEYGAEIRPWSHVIPCSLLYGTPFLAMHLRHWHDTAGDWDANRTFALGYEWSKLSGTGRKARIFLEYHEGFSLEGQFSRLRSEYLALKFMYGF